MIEFTIKTLDSNNHHFAVEDETTVQELKEKVREQMGIEPNLQRLIFCGRVLQDENRLSQYDVHGKVVHLVQRAPPGPEGRSQHDRSSSPVLGSGSGASGASGIGGINMRGPRGRFHNHNSTQNFNNPDDPENAAMQQEIRRVMVNSLAGAPDFVIDHHHQMSLSPTAGRLETIRRMIVEIKTSLACLRAHIAGEESSGEPASSEATLEAATVDNENATGATIDESEPQLDENGDEVLPEAPPVRFHPRRRSHRVVRVMRARHTQPRHLGQLIEELDSLQEQFAPFRATYVRLLRAANDPEPPLYTDEERQSNQRTADMVSDLLHSFAHAYHAISDITFTVGQRNPRLSAEAAVTRHLIPMQAHINVIQSNRRPQSQPSATTTSSTVGSGTTAAESASPQANAPSTTTSTNATATATVTASATATASATNSSNADANGQARGARQSATADFENLLRGLGHVGGVEVVMSMEEIPQGVGLGNLGNLASLGNLGNLVGGGATNAGNGTGAAQPGAATQRSEAGVVFSQMPLGGAPSADVLQNLLSTVIRQGLMPGVEGVAVQIPNSLAVQLHNLIETQVQAPGQTTTPPQSQAQGQTQTQGQSPGQTLAQTQAQTQVQSQVQTQAQSQAQTQAQSPPQSQATRPNQGQGADATPDSTSESRPGQEGNNAFRPGGGVQFFRTATTGRAQAQALALASLFYDRFLQCDSAHARRRLQRRREFHQQQLEQQERLRADRIATQNIEALRHRRLDLTPRHMTNVVHLLNSSPSPASWFNALMVAIARQQYMSGLLNTSQGEPALLPNEFQELKWLLRSYIQHLIIRSGNNESDNAFQSVADYIIDQNEEFIENMENVTPIGSDFDPVESIRALVRSRLPAVIACVMSDSNSEIFAARFYSMFLRIYTELCALVAHMCVEGESGLRQLYILYLDEIVEQFDEPIRSTMRVLGLDNMVGIMSNITNHHDSIAQFVRRRDGVMPDLSRPRLPVPTPMEVCADEPMRTTPPATPAVNAEVAPPPNDSPPETQNPSSSMQSSIVANCSSQSSSNSSPSRPSSRTNRTDRAESTSSSRSTSSDQNIRFVPPMVILQHWGEEWVPVFTRDQQTQRPDPPEPYSDAYLSGMPARKRRCVRQNRPAATLDGFMNESVREASERTNPVDSGAVRRAFREHVRSLARRRAAAADDYDPERYASAARFLNAAVSNRQDQTENENKENGG